MKLIVTLLLFLNISLYADSDLILRGAYGTSSASDFDQLYTFTGLNTSPFNTSVYNLALGKRFVENFYGLPIDFSVNGGVSYFDENAYQDNFLEATLYVKMYIKLNLFSNQFRYGIAEGVSYAGKVPWVEAQEAIVEGDNQSNLLNYMEMTFDFDIGKLIHVKSMHNLYLGYLIKHRSGAKGTYGGVYDGGSNYNALYLEKNF
ncbi:hypothetical protein JHD46_01225 [Sulfurimonas sp. SAG-AH-194-C20]|nr:hypothetical protein [Sulfurimonas sp. SAG-AH-194-C20]MDF1878254.1 hypothetical protein [Sulfurimonas sp. SAG-AH-194-C20]